VPRSPSDRWPNGGVSVASGTVAVHS
jgi:hypothetical protein